MDVLFIHYSMSQLLLEAVKCTTYMYHMCAVCTKQVHVHIHNYYRYPEPICTYVHKYNTLKIHLFEHSESLWVQDIDIFVLSPHHNAADSIGFFMTLLEGRHTRDGGLTLQGNVLEHRGER